MPNRRIAITAMDAVTVAGHGVDVLWDHVSDPEAHPGDGTIHEAVEEVIPRRRRRRMSRFTQLIHIAGEPMAEPADANRSAIVVGTAYGGLETVHEQFAVHGADGDRAVSPVMGVMFPVDAPAAELAATLGWTGPTVGLSTACASGAHAVLEGARLIADGTCDVVLAGGVEERYVRPVLAAFERLGVISPTGVSRPFDVDRDGFVPAEGAAVLRLEALEVAEARGATRLGEIRGWAAATDPGAGWSPDDATSITGCMRRALDHAGVEPAAIGHVNAHGTGTQANDAVEAEAIAAVVGTDTPVVSVKGAIGHCGGGAGAVELVASLDAIRRGVLPPTAGFRRPDPQIAVPVSDASIPLEPAPFITNSIGLGGHLACLVVVP